MPSRQRCFYEEDAVKHGMALDSAPAEKFREDVIYPRKKNARRELSRGNKGFVDRRGFV